MLSGMEPTSAPSVHDPTSNPAAPPASEISKLSVRSCRINLHRPAPIAIRTAISLCLASPRATRRLARFAQAISSTNPTIDIRIIRGLPASCCRIGRPCDPVSSRIFLSRNCFFLSGDDFKSEASDCKTAEYSGAIPASAFGRLMPGFNLPSIASQ